MNARKVYKLACRAHRIGGDTTEVLIEALPEKRNVIEAACFCVAQGKHGQDDYAPSPLGVWGLAYNRLFGAKATARRHDPATPEGVRRVLVQAREWANRRWGE